MQPSVQRVTELFEQQRRFVVPLFQRSYVWTFQNQWQPLWEDIERQARKLERLPPNAPLPPDATHFLGAIVVQNESPSGAGRPPVSTIIDGQQRLVTFQLLLAAIRDRLRDRGDPFLVRFEAYTANHGPYAEPEDRFKVWPTNSDRTGFQSAMTAGASGTPVGSRHRLEEAYRFFSEEFEAFIGSNEEAEPGDGHASTAQSRVSAIYNALAHSLRFVVIQLDEHEDPQIIFESLNARGEPLLPSDLIKNYLFLEAGDNALDWYNAHWQHFEADMWRENLPRLRERRPMVDIFFQLYLIERPNRPEVNINQLYLEFKDWRVKTRHEFPIKPLLADIADKAKCFAKIVQRDHGPKVDRLYELILAMDTFVAMPLLLHVLSRKSAQAEIDGALDLLESFIVRRWFCERPARNQASVYGKILDGVRTCDDTQMLTTLRAQLARSETNGRKSWPSDLEFETAWRTKQLYYSTRSERAKVVLCALEAAIGGNAMTDKAEVEHVLPQDADENTYPFARHDTYQANSERRRQLLHSVGNLTMLESNLNQAAANLSFQHKKEHLRSSVFALNAYFDKCKQWTEDDIEARADRLFGTARTLWIAPPS
jgi:hypothetical protein